MSVSSDLKELESLNQGIQRINAEIKRLRGDANKLKERADAANERIISYCNNQDTPGLKYQGKAIVVRTKEARASKKESDRQQDAIKVLASKGVDNPEKVYNEIMEARKGDVIEKRKLEIKAYN